VPLEITDFDIIGKKVPLLANLSPHGPCVARSNLPHMDTGTRHLPSMDTGMRHLPSMAVRHAIEHPRSAVSQQRIVAQMSLQARSHASLSTFLI
jgi:hypothetical protein